tara:strand:- start:32 stop:1069 length:1038 start_codon:yes stop_codon:yes gene_type:complete
MAESELPIQDQSSSTEEENNERNKLTKLQSQQDIEISLNKVDGITTLDSKQKSELNDKQSNEILEEVFKDIKLKREKLTDEIDSLTKRKSQLELEIKSSFAGQSDSIARKVKGFQDYLTGALQDLAHSAEQMELIKQNLIIKPSPLDKNLSKEDKEIESVPVAISDTFKPDKELIKGCLDQFLQKPDFYAEPWKLRRSLDEKDIALLEDWFFSMGGRGAQPSRGSRQRNVLVSSGLISILGELYGDRFQTLVLASQPERLGEWRRGLQDALGLSREDFGPNSGIVLFERPEGVLERADRLEDRGEVPLILIDSAEKSVEIPLLQFPLWIAFAADPEELYLEEELL